MSHNFWCMATGDITRNDSLVHIFLFYPTYKWFLIIWKSRSNNLKGRFFAMSYNLHYILCYTFLYRIGYFPFILPFNENDNIYFQKFTISIITRLRRHKYMIRIIHSQQKTYTCIIQHYFCYSTLYIQTNKTIPIKLLIGS